MSEVDVSRVVEAPLERVWAVFTDLERAAERLSGVERVEVATPGRFGVGTTWWETRLLNGKSAVEELTVTECDPGQRYVLETENDGGHYRSEFTFTPDGPARTRVRVVFDAHPHGVLGRVVGTVLGGLVARAVATTVEQDLNDLAWYCENAPAEP